MVNVKKLML